MKFRAPRVINLRRRGGASWEQRKSKVPVGVNITNLNVALDKKREGNSKNRKKGASVQRSQLERNTKPRRGSGGKSNDGLG